MSGIGVNDVAAVYGAALSIPGACGYCSSPHSAVIHGGPCPRVKAIEYHPNGAVKRVELEREGEFVPHAKAGKWESHPDA